MPYFPASSPNARAASTHMGVGRFGHEMSLVAGALALGFWVLALLSHSVLDPAWSTSGALLDNVLHNRGGRAGAWLADLSYFALGFSVWWLPAACALVWCKSAKRWARGQGLSAAGIGERVRFWLGLLVLLASSCTLEWARLYGWERALPGYSGGVVGYLLGQALQPWLGGDGLVLVLLALMLPSVAGVFNFSWGALSVKLGALIEAIVRWRRAKREHERDAVQGRIAAEERARDLQRQAQDFATSEPLRIVRAGAAETTQPANAPNPEQDKPHFGPRLQEPTLDATPEPVAAVAAQSRSAAAQNAPTWTLPSLELLSAPANAAPAVDAQTLEMTSRLIEKKLHDFGVSVRVLEAAPGPVVTRYDLEPASGVKGAQVVALARDLARALSLPSVRVMESVPGKSCMALEIPNARRQSIALASVLGDAAFAQSSAALPLALGQDPAGQPVIADLATMPHVLVAGTTGSGKSVGIHAMLLSLLFRTSPEQLRLVLIDPKMVELAAWDGIAHLLTPVLTDMQQAAQALAWCVDEMQRRYERMARQGVRNIAAWNALVAEQRAQAQQQPRPKMAFSPLGHLGEPANVPVDNTLENQVENTQKNDIENPNNELLDLEPMPAIVIVVDELADLMMVAGKEVENHIARIAQKARAAGIHLILATQRPTANVVTGLIKTNVPARIAYYVNSKTDSRIILDQNGAETLLGQGDMLYLASGKAEAQRIHGAYVSDADIAHVARWLRAQRKPQYSLVLD